MVRHLKKPRQGVEEEGFTPFAAADEEVDYDAAMRLPEGKTCGDCVHCRRCVAMFGHTPADTSCDFYPSRYHAAQPQGEAA